VCCLLTPAALVDASIWACETVTVSAVSQFESVSCKTPAISFSIQVMRLCQICHQVSISHEPKYLADQFVHFISVLEFFSGFSANQQ
jgi:hypothetical protein